MKRLLYKILLILNLLRIDIVMAAEIDYSNICGNSGVSNAMVIIGYIIQVAKWIVPLIIVVLGMVDYGKASISNDEKAVNKATVALVRRIVAGIVIFFVPTIISAFTKNILKTNIDSEFLTCTNCMFNPGTCQEQVKLLKDQEKEDAANKRDELEQDRIEKEEQEKKEEEEKEQQNNSNNDNNTNDDNSNSNNDNNNSPNGSIQKTANISVNYYNNFSYWLYLPDKIVPNLPIVVYLPGLGERGNDYKSGASTGIMWGPINEIKDYNYSYNAIIIHMQVPSGASVYTYINDYIKLIDKIADEYSANKNKISVIGFSHGCYGIIDLIAAYPNYFSAVVPIGCAPNKKNDLSKFINQPIWTFVGGGDGNSDYYDQYGSHYSLSNFDAEINKLGGNAKHTSVKDKANVHNILNDNYSILRDKEYNVINWMISQTK